MGKIARVGLMVILAVPFFGGLGGEEFHGDEVHWISGGREAFWLVSEGRLGDPEWREEFYFYSQPQVGKVLIGAAEWVAGYRGKTRVVDYEWQLLPEQNRALGRMPEPGEVLAGRVPGAVMGWLGCLLLWGLAELMGLHGVGPVAAVLLASQPLWLANARRAGLDVPALTLGLAAVAAVGMAVRGERGRANGDETRRAGSAARGSGEMKLAWWAWWGTAGALLGLAVGTKYVALLAALGAVAFWSWRPRVILGGVVSGGVAVATFYLTNPALYGDPWGQLNVSLGFLAYQAEGMRHTIPEFRSPVWVAAEIVDRMVWPVGGPRVVERSMLEPLIPGTYGTPVVTLGAAVALLSLARPGRGRRGVVATGVWLALVYAALAVSLPTWWERWHLPLVLPLALMGACGLAALPRGRKGMPVGWAWAGGRAGMPVGWALAGAQAAGAVALLPSYLNKGFGHLVMTPLGAVAHLAALAYALATLVSLAVISGRESRRGTGERALTWRAAKTASAP